MKKYGKILKIVNSRFWTDGYIILFSVSLEVFIKNNFLKNSKFYKLLNPNEKNQVR